VVHGCLLDVQPSSRPATSPKPNPRLNIGAAERPRTPVTNKRAAPRLTPLRVVVKGRRAHTPERKGPRAPVLHFCSRLGILPPWIA
jgi:hypothetical protein